MNSLPQIVGKCCEMIDDDTLVNNESLITLFLSSKFTEWPTNVRTQIAYSLKSSLDLQVQLSEFLNSTIPSLSEDTIETKILWQLIEIAVSVDSIESVAPLINPSKISKSSSGPSDVHRLIISLGKLGENVEIPTAVWQSVLDKLVSPGMLPVFEIEGTLAALSAARVSSDSFFQNTNLFKKKISSPNLSKLEFHEIVCFLLLTGDKSSQSIVTRAIMERRDLFVPTTNDIEEIDILVSVLLLSVVSSLE